MTGVGWVRLVGHYNSQYLMVGGWVVGTAGGTAGGSVELSVTVESVHCTITTPCDCAYVTGLQHVQCSVPIIISVIITE